MIWYNNNNNNNDIIIIIIITIFICVFWPASCKKVSYEEQEQPQRKSKEKMWETRSAGLYVGKAFCTEELLDNLMVKCIT